jgi:uncharacterized membrane protein YqgA involved in biofilm formation
MLGPVVNAGVIVLCGLGGCFLIKGIPPRFEDTIKKAIGLSTIFMGIRGAMESEMILLLIMSMVGGVVIGEGINIDKQMNRFGAWAEGKLGMGDGTFSRGFISASILFCTGSMALVGSIQSGLLGSHETLYAKSILDGVMSIVFGASLGLGVVFSALPVLIYQGGIALASMAVKELLSPEIIREMSAVGSLLVAAIGFNFVTSQEIRVANFIPAVFIPWVYLALRGLLPLPA